MSAQPTGVRRLRRRGSQLFGLMGYAANRVSDRLASGDGGASLHGDRTVEWSFCLARLAEGPGTTLDFGADIGFLSLAAAMRGHDVVALDRMSPALEYRHERVTACQADVLDRPLADRRFDQIINCSSVEHVGLSGRYGSFEAADGDLEAMQIMRGMLAPGGRMLLTIPVGRDMVCRPYHRIYGAERLPRLLDSYDVVEEQYWRKDPAAREWTPTDRDTALATAGSDHFYSLGLFVLRAPSP